MKTHIKRVKSYLTMAEVVVSILRDEVEKAEESPTMSEDVFLDLIVDARKLLKYALYERAEASAYAQLVNFEEPAQALLSRIDRMIGEELVFSEEKVCPPSR